MRNLEILDSQVLNNRVVNARDLHTSLESKREFATWIKNKVINNQAFIENEDYSLLDNIVTQTEGRGGHNKIDYALTLDTAKNVALMEHTPKGNEVRRYFIECEKELVLLQPKLPKTLPEALRLYADKIEENEKQSKLLEAQKPKVEFFDAVADSKSAVSMNDASKVLAIKGFGRNNLFEFLRNKKILMQNNRPYQKYVDCGYFRVIEQRFMKQGEECINFKTLVYQKGLNYIRKQLEKK